MGLRKGSAKSITSKPGWAVAVGRRKYSKAAMGQRASQRQWQRTTRAAEEDMYEKVEVEDISEVHPASVEKKLRMCRDVM